MKVANLHPWEVTPSEARQIQEFLREKVSLKGAPQRVRLVAGCDVAFDLKEEKAYGCVRVYRLPELVHVETRHAIGKIAFPYVPGLLSFREAPVLLAAMARLRHAPDVFIFDGQGIAHPRRMGIATHLGILLKRPTIGCAKSRLFGCHAMPAKGFGCYALLYDEGGRIVGAVLRTRENVKPVYVSPGFGLNWRQAIKIVLACCDGFRIPKPTREADHYAGELKRGAVFVTAF